MIIIFAYSGFGVTLLLTKGTMSFIYTQLTDAQRICNSMKDMSLDAL